MPYATGPGIPTIEHFPDLHSFEVKRTANGTAVLANTRIDGTVEVFDDLVFHGGEGFTLEMRVFSEESLMEELRRAGFGSVKIYGEPDFQHGIFWSDQWSLPMVARLQKGSARSCKALSGER